MFLFSDIVLYAGGIVFSGVFGVSFLMVSVWIIYSISVLVINVIIIFMIILLFILLLLPDSFIIACFVI